MKIVKRWVEKIAAQSEIVKELRSGVAIQKDNASRLREEHASSEAEIDRLLREIDRLDKAKAEQNAAWIQRLEQAECEALRRRRDWRRPEEAMDAEQLAAAFDVPADLALWQAVHQELDAEIMGAVDDATAPGCADRDFRSGGVDALRGFQRRLIDARSKAQVAKRQKKEEE